MKSNNYHLTFFAFIITSFSFAQMHSYAKKIELKGIDSLWHNIEIPNTVFKDLNANLSDIRIYGITATDTIEAPYIHKTSKATQANDEISFNLLNRVHNTKGYYFTYELPNKETINEIILDLKDQNFNWEITLEGSQHQKQWFTILEDYRILSINNNQTNYAFTTLKFSDTSYRYYRLLIKSDVEPKLATVKILKKAKKEAAYRNYQVQSFQVKEQEKNTIVDVELSTKVPLDFLTVTVDDNFDYYRSISIQYLADSVKSEKGWHYNYRPLTTKTLSSMEDNSFELPSILAKKVRIIILNYDNQPLNISSVALRGFIHTLTTRFTAPANYFMVYGKNKDKSPNYDIAKTKLILPQNITNLNLGKTIDIQKKESITTAPLFENKWWLWGITGLIIILLGYFTIGMMKKEL